MQGCLKISPSLRASAALSEEPTEKITEVRKVSGETSSRRPDARCRGTETANFVVLLTLNGISDDVVGRGNLLKAVLGALARVGVVLLSELAVRLRNLVVARRGGDS
jgi:hypothetical protein